MVSVQCVSIGKVAAVRETDSALQIAGKGSDCVQGTCWIPKSVIHDNSEVYKVGDTGHLVVKAWFANRKGWI